MAHCMYLLHGITLFVMFTFMLGLGQSPALSPMTRWLVVAGIRPVLVSLCFCTFRYLESHAIRGATTLVA